MSKKFNSKLPLPDQNSLKTWARTGLGTIEAKIEAKFRDGRTIHSGPLS